MEPFTRRPALGQKVAIGALYNARKDQFLSDSLLKQDMPEGAYAFLDQRNLDVSTSYGDSYRKRFDMLGMPSNLVGSILADSVRCSGASRYLAEPREGRSMHAALQHTIDTCNQMLNFHFEGLRNHLTSTTVSNPDATHMVAGIDWGSKIVISARLWPDSAADSASVDDELQVLFAKFASAISTLTAADPGINGDLRYIDSASPPEITAYSEMFDDDDGILLEDFEEAYKFLQMVPLHVKGERNGKGWPISYSLLPVEMLALFLQVQAPQVRHISYPAQDLLDSGLSLFDEYLTCERKLDDYQSSLFANAHYLPAGTQRALADRLRKLHIAKQRFKDDFARTLSSVKSGYMDPGALRQILDQYQRGDMSPDQIGNVSITGSEALDFIKAVVASGAEYVGHNGVRLGSILPDYPGSEAYVFYFSPTAMKDQTAWKLNVDQLLALLQKCSADTVVAVVDCDATCTMLDKVHIVQYQDGHEVVEDLLAYQSFMADKCFAECDDKTLETEDIQPPIQRRHVTIACPGSNCSVAKVHEWLCPRCMAPVEYGYSDQYIYCRCGRSLYSNYLFKCSSDVHGPQFTPYDPQQLLRLLNGLIQANYLNILILGETGVGKSTFINAMVNYLEFETLDEAIDAGKLNYVIPCSFSTQIMDRTNPDRPIEEKRIMVGSSSSDEHDGSKGDSATQRTTVYPVTFHSGESTLTVRLIDTPGIGDTRGPDVDDKNMADILSTLSGYDTVHGILILLKSNNARLGITFKYCIKALLTHLHNDAAANMAFGFTNTRISNYTPGDTYGPMKTLLKDNRDVGLSLETPTTYCFDSESFRYLAALKNGVTMENKLEFDRSWSQSRQETTRLIQHFQAIPPHEVKNTMSLNGARQLISELTKPLAEITQSINTNILLVEDQMEALKNTRIRGDELRNMLHVQKVQLNAVPLSQPRTVCADKDCIEVQDDGKGQNTMVILYKQHCHPACHLTSVQADVMAHPALINCAAFSGNYCSNCRHYWQQHLHVLYELEAETITMMDNGVQQQLANHADDITLKQTAIEELEERVSEYRQEQEIIRDAAAKFCVFLKKNSMAAYNDALVAYLDHLIKEEQAKVQAGGNNWRLLSLTEERQKHEEAIKVITQHMNSNVGWNDLSEGGVDRMVQGLYNLKHFGENLKKMKQGIATAHQATYREKPHTVHRRNQPRGIVRPPINQPRRYQPSHYPPIQHQSSHHRSSHHQLGREDMQTRAGAHPQMLSRRPTGGKREVASGSSVGGIISNIKGRLGFGGV